jgi:outer membrane receptor for ferric coprogen and ferric-rhodotorulic acid
MVYATVSRGFRSGGFNVPRSIFSQIYSPEKLWNYEIGYKGDWLAHTLRTNAAFFYEAIRDKQDFVFDGVNAAQTIYNIPRSHVSGVELELAYELLGYYQYRCGEECEPIGRRAGHQPRSLQAQRMGIQLIEYPLLVELVQPADYGPAGRGLSG